jgi:hypothetical protein
MCQKIKRQNGINFLMVHRTIKKLGGGSKEPQYTSSFYSAVKVYILPC